MFLVIESIHDDNGANVTTQAVGAPFLDLGRAIQYMDYLAERAKNDTSPLTVGWTVDFKVVSLGCTGNARTQIQFGANA